MAITDKQHHITECKMMGGGKSLEKGRTVIQCHYIKFPSMPHVTSFVKYTVK